MADALISPAVGGTMFLTTGSLIAYCSNKISKMGNSLQIPLMGIMGAFVFAAQMVNFAIPMTGSSGHLCGGLLLAVLLGPHAAFIVIASILTVQCLFFMDGGLLALGANIFNMGFFPCFVAYPFVYKPLAGEYTKRWKVAMGAIAASILAVELGALGVVIETCSSGITELPFGKFALLMLPIHFVIGIVEGCVTYAIILLLCDTRKEILEKAASTAPYILPKHVLKYLLIATCVIASLLTWFASSSPDGLEWALEKSGISEKSENSGGIHAFLEKIQAGLAFMPDYAFKNDSSIENAHNKQDESNPSWPNVSPETSLAGLFGGTITFLFAILAALVAKQFSRRKGHCSVP